LRRRQCRACCVTCTLQNVPLSNSIVSRRIEYTSCDIECELIIRIVSSKGFAMQVDESSDVIAVLLAFVRYIYNIQVEEEMLMCKHLLTHTTG
jgi:hypothetical protein